MAGDSLEAIGSTRLATNGAGKVQAGLVERRKRVRTRLHWSVSLYRSSDPEDVVETVTQNLSSSGFYCLTGGELMVGEQFLCAIRIPTHDPRGRQTERTLECRVQVMRVSPHESGGFGVACRIEDYHIASQGSDGALS